MIKKKYIYPLIFMVAMFFFYVIYNYNGEYENITFAVLRSETIDEFNGEVFQEAHFYQNCLFQGDTIYRDKDIAYSPRGFYHNNGNPIETDFIIPDEKLPDENVFGIYVYQNKVILYTSTDEKVELDKLYTEIISRSLLLNKKELLEEKEDNILLGLSEPFYVREFVSSIKKEDRVVHSNELMYFIQDQSYSKPQRWNVVYYVKSREYKKALLQRKYKEHWIESQEIEIRSNHILSRESKYQMREGQNKNINRRHRLGASGVLSLSDIEPLASSSKNYYLSTSYAISGKDNFACEIIKKRYASPQETEIELGILAEEIDGFLQCDFMIRNEEATYVNANTEMRNIIIK